MQLLIVIVLGLALQLVPKEPPNSPALRLQEPWVSQALKVLEQRDPAAHREFSEALARGHAEVGEEIVGHALYLLELEELKAEHPALQQGLERQERVEAQVHRLVETLSSDESSVTGYEETAAALQGLLEDWFELRQFLRSLESEGLVREHQKLHELTRSIEKHPDEAGEEWISRLADPSPEAREELQHQIDSLEIRHLLAPDLAARFVELLPQTAAELHWLSARSEQQLSQRLEQLCREYPAVLAEVTEEAARDIEQRERLKSAIVAARDRIEPLRQSDRSLELTPGELEKIRALTHEIAMAELALTRTSLEYAAAELARTRKLLVEREEHREAIIALEFARITGNEALYEW